MTSCRFLHGYVLQLTLLLLTAANSTLRGEENLGTTNAPDKSHFTLFNPTPIALMREMDTDRPDKTESAFTVDAGHFQVEMDLVTHTRDRDTSGGGDLRTTSYSVAPINLKVGLLNNVDFQLIVETWNTVTVKDNRTGASFRRSGFGDVTPRLKVNLWGNDGGSTALALMPYVKLPTNQDKLGNNAVEGGVIVPFAMDLPLGFDLGAMTVFGAARNEDNSRHHAEFVNTVTVGHDLIGKLGAYAEFFSLVSTESGADWVGTADVGLVYALTPNIHLDASVNFGVTRSADDLNLSAGLSFRF